MPLILRVDLTGTSQMKTVLFVLKISTSEIRVDSRESAEMKFLSATS
jgi:hypothetical protein